MPVLYLDVLIAVNLLIDFLLLSAAARILRLPVRKGRLLAGASVGALSCCMILLPPLPAAVSVLLKLAAAALVIRVTFRWFGWRTYIKEITAFLSSTLWWASHMPWYCLPLPRDYMWWTAWFITTSRP